MVPGLLTEQSVEPETAALQKSLCGLKLPTWTGWLFPPPFTVSLVGATDTQQTWSNSFDDNLVGALAPGSYQITAVIDPFSDGEFTQEDTTNDRVSSNMIILESPDFMP